jgi:glyoxylase-like metal-dependent hydrolase (beta-lactamase superfamily II)
MKQIADGIFYEDSFPGVTLGAMMFSQGVIIIDAPLRSEDALSWRSMLINQRGWSNRLLVNMDAHLDRTLGVRTMESTILAHQETADVFQSRPMVFKGMSVGVGEEWESYSDVIGTRWAPPDITFSKSMTLYWGGPRVVLEHHPGPLPGSIWIILPDEGVMFVGDTVVLDQPPFFANADLEAWLSAFDLLVTQYCDYTVISGRGGPANQDAIRANQRFVRSVFKRMEKLAHNYESPDATEKMIPVLMKRLSFLKERQDGYTRRLRYGLYQCYSHRYSQMSFLSKFGVDSEEK